MWRPRKRTPPLDPVDTAAREAMRKARLELQAMKPHVHARHGRLLKLGVILDEIREENHFSYKIFGDS